MMRFELGRRAALGLGASAIGTSPGGYVQNITQELGWRHAVADGRLPIARGVAVTDEDRFRADIIERLMCDFAVDLVAACDRHGRKLAELDGSIARLQDFIADGLDPCFRAKINASGQCVDEADVLPVVVVCLKGDIHPHSRADDANRR